MGHCYSNDKLQGAQQAKLCACLRPAQAFTRHSNFSCELHALVLMALPHVLQKFLVGLQSSMCGLVDSNSAQRRPNYQAEVTAAIMGQRQLRSHLDANEAMVLCGVHAVMAKHNLEQPWERVLAVHEDMLVSCFAVLSVCC